jgi:hypothetical protein
MEYKKHFADKKLDSDNPTRCVISYRLTNNYYSKKATHGTICGRSLMGVSKFDVCTDEGEILLNINGKYIIPEDNLNANKPLSHRP